MMDVSDILLAASTFANPLHTSAVPPWYAAGKCAGRFKRSHKVDAIRLGSFLEKLFLFCSCFVAEPSGQLDL